MSKTAKRHVVYYFIQDEYGCNPYLFEWTGQKNDFSHQEIARKAQKRHAYRSARKYKERQEEVRVQLDNDKYWKLLKQVSWWIGSYTWVIVKFSIQLAWKMVVVFFAIVLGQLLLGMFLTRR
jgi:hypothetical protein